MKKKYILWCLSAALFRAAPLNAQTGHTAVFVRDSLKLEQRTGDDGKSYVSVGYPGCRASGQTGEPSLPASYLTFLVPDPASRYVVEVHAQESIPVPLENPVYPVQPPVFNSPEQSAPAFVTYDPGQFAAGYPSQPVSIVREGYFDGDKRLVTVRVTPFRYTGETNELDFYTRLEFTLRPDLSRSAGPALAPVHRSCMQNTEELARELSFVENRETVPALLQQQAAANTPVRSAGLQGQCEYLIVTSQEYVDQAEKLAFWKRLKGLTAGVETIEHILTNPTIRGDEVSGIYDEAGKVRQFLKDCFIQRGTKYVLLVGQYVPYRVSIFETNYFNGHDFVTIIANVATDLYYCDLNGNWNVDGDDWYGEPDDDAVDFAPELYVGRILCKDPSEFDNYLYKLYCYEKNPGNGQADYLKKAFYLHADHLQSGKFAYDMSGAMQSSIGFNNISVFEEKPTYNAINTTFPHGNEVINEMNKNYGFVYLAAHGNPCAISIMTNGNNPSPDDISWQWLDAIKAYKSKDITGHKMQSPNNSVDCLTNTNYPNVIYTTSCETMPFDREYNPDAIYNMGEAFTIMEKYGAVAYLGSTWLTSGTKADMELYFSDALKEGYNCPGYAEAVSKIKLENRKHATVVGHNLLGCPEFKMWNKIPTAFDQLTITSSLSPQYPEALQIKTGISESCKVNIIGLFGGNHIFRQETIVSNTGYLLKNLPKNYLISVMNKDKLPYIAPLYLQNESVTGRHCIFHVNQVWIGSNVDTRKSAGNFVIKRGSNVSIEASGEVILDKGFEVEAGASFEISFTNLN